MRLAWCEHQLDRIAQGIDECMNFGSQSTAGSSDGLRAVFFRAPVLTAFAILTDGLIYAAYLFVVAVGLTLIFGVMRILRARQGIIESIWSLRGFPRRQD